MTSNRKYRLGVAVDVVVLTVDDGRLRVLLTKRERAPFEGQWALPGGFVGERQSAEQAAAETLARKAGVSDVYLEQLYTFSAPDRDPRSRVVTIAYYALVPQAVLPPHGGSRESRWFDLGTGPVDPETDPQTRYAPANSRPSTSPGLDGQMWIGALDDRLEPLAFDHDEIVQTALARIRGKLEYVPLGFQLLPAKFTLTDIQLVYEAILGQPVDKRNFRTKLLRSGLVEQVDEYRTGAHRPARLFRFTHPTF